MKDDYLYLVLNQSIRGSCFIEGIYQSNPNFMSSFKKKEKDCCKTVVKVPINTKIKQHIN